VQSVFELLALVELEEAVFKRGYAGGFVDLFCGELVD